MQTFFLMTKRNIKLFFKDKGMFFASLITPIILLVLYITFLANIYKENFVSNIPQGIDLPSNIINGVVNGQLSASLLAVCGITVAFCANMLMVTDKVNGSRKDFIITPAKKSSISMSYYVATLITTLIVCLISMGACFIYIGATGWFLSLTDVLLILIDVFLISMLGTALSSIINIFLTSQGQISAVGTVVSAGYGFICGAYMPISQFSVILQNILAFLPGTYGTSLIKNHFLNGTFREMAKYGFSSDAIESIKSGLDCNIKFFGNTVSTGAMYGIMIGSIALIIGLYILINVLKSKKLSKHKKIIKYEKTNKNA